MSPLLTITSVGEAARDATNNYRRYSKYAVSLRKAGNIQITIDDDGTLYYSEKIEQYLKPQVRWRVLLCMLVFQTKK